MAEASALAGRVMDEVARAVVGKRETLMLVLAAILAKGHVLLEDFPGLGKTLAARSFAQALGLVLAARAFALLRGRDYVIPEDVKAVARSVLSHRITVKPELWMTQASGRRVVDAVLGQVPTPTTLRGPAG